MKKAYKKLLFSLAFLAVISLTALFAFGMQQAGTSAFAKTGSTTAKADYKILSTWELPKSLDEISAITWLGNDQVAAVEDEDGIIFIYDLDKKAVVANLPFGEKGDYEGLAVKGTEAYVMRSDGKLFKIANFREDSRKVTSFSTFFKSKNNMESLFYDKGEQALLTLAKNKDPKHKNHKGIYMFSLKAKKILPDPLFKIDLKDKAFDDFDKKNDYKTLMPSDLAINPETGEIFVLEGRRPKLVVFNQKGNVSRVYELDKDDFPQPEGICFSPDGSLYISNEAHKGPATILKVVLK